MDKGSLERISALTELSRQRELTAEEIAALYNDAQMEAVK